VDAFIPAQPVAPADIRQAGQPPGSLALGSGVGTPELSRAS
jgi:hypothetical protein